MAQIKAKQIQLTAIGDLVVGDTSIGGNFSGSILAAGAANTFLQSNGASTLETWEYIGQLRDTNGNLVVDTNTLVSQGNYVTISAASGVSGPSIAATGPGTDIDINITPKGTGEVLAPVSYTPVSANALITKEYADSVATGLDVKNSVRLATSASGELSGYTYNSGNEPTGLVWTGVTSDPTFDGETVNDGDRILIKDALDARGNGIFVYDDAQDAFIRAEDANTSTGPGQVSGGLFTFVEEGGAQADTGWVASQPNGPATLGTDDIVMTQFSAAGVISVVEGDGINVSQFGVQYTVEADADGATIRNTGGSGAQLAVGEGTNNYIMTSNGPGTDATWQQLDLSGTNTSLTGILGVTDGGTGLGTIPQGSVLVANSADTLTALDGGSGGPTSNQVLIYNYITDTLAWQDASGIVANAYGQINGDTGSATASTNADQITIQGASGAGISTAAAEGSPDTLDISIDFSTLTSVSTITGTDEIIIDQGAGPVSTTLSEIVSDVSDAYITITGDSGTANASGQDTLNFAGTGGIATAAANGSPDSVTIDLDFSTLPVGSAGQIDGTEQIIINDGGTNTAVTINDLTEGVSDRYNAITDGTTTENAASGGDTITFSDGAGVALTVTAPDTVTADIDFSTLSAVSVIGGTDQIIIDQGSGPVSTTINELIGDIAPSYGTIGGDTGTANAVGTGDTINILGAGGIVTTGANGSPDSITVDLDISTLPVGSAGSIDGTETIVINDGGTNTQVTINDLIDANVFAYNTLNGDSGTATADSATTALNIVGTGGNVVTITEPGTDTVTIDLDISSLPVGSAGTIDGTETIIINDGGTNTQVTINDLIDANVEAYTTITGDSGTATAASATDTLNLAGSGGIVTTAGEGSPDSVDIDLDITSLPDASAGQIDGSEELVVSDGGTNVAVTVDELFDSQNVGQVGYDEFVIVTGGTDVSLSGFFSNTPINDDAITIYFNGLALRGNGTGTTGWTRSGTTLVLDDSVNGYAAETGDVITARYEY